MDEEVGRAARHGTALSCLLVDIEGLDEIAETHGPELSERALVYATSALCNDLRRFDRVGRISSGELVVVLPGADGSRGEIVARRALGRLRSIKIESAGARRPLRVSVAIAAWHRGQSAEQLLELAGAAAPRERLLFPDALGL
jgi:diguanylate cyclase (GGDEF)-like protein